MHIKKFEPNIHPLKSKDPHPLCSQNQHQSPSWKPTNPSKHKIRSKLETHRSPPSPKTHHSLEPTLWNQNPQTHKSATDQCTNPPQTHNPKTQIYTTELRDREMKERNLPIWERETMIRESGLVIGR